MDDRGHGLRATWHRDQHFVNVSLWREDRCVETFRLSASEAARFADFLVDGRAAASTAAGPDASVGRP